MARGRENKVATEAPLLYIEWVDHHANGAWQDEVDHTPAVCRSIGWLIKEDAKGLTLAGSKGAEGKAIYGNTQYIIKSCVVKREKR